MAPDNRPRGRETTHVGGTGQVHKEGSGLGTGPVGNGGRQSSSAGASSHGSAPHGNSSRGPERGNSGNRNSSGGGLGKLISIIAAAVVLLGGGGGLLSGVLGGSGDTSSYDTSSTYSGTSSSSTTSADALSGILEMLISGYTTTSSEYSDIMSTYSDTSYNSSSETNTASIDTSVASGSREKYTSIVGSGADQVTIMVYMCGTDLESKSGMGTADLQEMAKATLSENVNLIVYTGGCSGWKNNVVSSSVNQIYQVKDGGLKCLEKDMGTGAMTDPATLTEFIKYCAENYPANRNDLIFWDHGGGSLSGYGYDEKYSSSGSMKLSGINTALKDAGIKFDFIGFDACLMATVENGLMLSDYADYMIASEETEPGVGWYYTNWLTALSSDPSMSTVEIGKNIIDDFVNVCASKCSGQKATLSVVDLAELSNTVPSKLSAFSSATASLIKEDDGYATVSTARNNTKEFAESSKIDQIDLIHFATLLDTNESKELADALKGAVKYNRTEKTIQNAYGLSIYFPYKKVSKLQSMVSTYDAIGMDSEYTRCIEAFASAEGAGQYQTDGSSLSSMLSALMGRSNISDENDTTVNSFDESKLVFTENSNGENVIKLSEDDWKNVTLLDLSVYYDDGEGFIDLGLDNVYDYDDDGNLIGAFDGSWMSIDGQVVPYYHTDTEENGDTYSINGYVPAFVNGERAEILIRFDNDHPEGYISGARYIYEDENTETVAKNTIALSAGDELQFICDYYTYEGEYEDSYILGDTLVLSDDPVIGNIDLENADKVSALYVFTDIYQQKHYSEVLP